MKIFVKNLFWERYEIKNPRILGKMSENIVSGCEKMLEHKNQKELNTGSRMTRLDKIQRDIVGEKSGSYLFSDVQFYKVVEIWTWNLSLLMKDVRIYSKHVWRVCLDKRKALGKLLYFEKLLRCNSGKIS